MDADFFLYWRRVAEGWHRGGNECFWRILLPTRIGADVHGLKLQCLLGRKVCYFADACAYKIYKSYMSYKFYNGKWKDVTEAVI